MDQTTAVPFRGERQAAVVVIGNLIRAIKSYALYPVGHEKRRDALERCYQDLSDFLQTYHQLRLDIGKDCLVFNGETIHSAPPEQGNLPFVFFRDGIQTLEFQDGIDFVEVETFLDLLNDHWILTDEPEGDLVTALWDARLPHIRYVVSDLFWGKDPELELHAFSIGKKAANGTVLSESRDSDQVEALRDAEDSGDGKRSVEDFGTQVWLKPIDPDAVELTPEESRRLFEWTIQEEKKDPLTDFLNVLLDSLLEIRDTQEVEVFLDTLKTLFQNLILQRNWEKAALLLKEVEEMGHRHTDPADDSSTTVAAFFKDVSDWPVLSLMEKALIETPSGELAPIQKMLLRLPPEAIPALCRLFTPNLDLKTRDMLTAVIEILASRDVGPLASMLKNTEEPRLCRLVSILGRLKGATINGILEGLIHHPSAMVRREAAAALLRRNPENIHKVFFLIDDDDERVRRLILGFVSRFRNPVLEDMLLEHLQSHGSRLEDKDHLVSCFKALGFCGSSRSLPFLEKILNTQTWRDLFRTSGRIQGALLALKAIGTPQAKELLEKAARSLHPGIRRAAKEALKE
ncbi:MAG: HEAT repeat domain-containing protein [Deltaproteobacteria bacterium]|nr:HEAT repeat domain-containing protein [Deltaproteobacteria bacterium]